MATVEYLGDTTLQALDGSERKFKASELWQNNGVLMMAVRRPGCILCREEAKGLSSLKPQLDAAGISLYAVVHELLGVEEFKPFFDGTVFFDSERRFYGPHERWAPLTALFSTSVWKNIFRARGKGLEGNLKGEGRLLGGLFLLGPGSTGILFEHKEKEFGDHASHEDVLAAVENFKSKSVPSNL
jgi:hypothetical protein